MQDFKSLIKSTEHFKTELSIQGLKLDLSYLLKEGQLPWTKLIF